MFFLFVGGGAFCFGGVYERIRKLPLRVYGLYKTDEGIQFKPLKRFPVQSFLKRKHKKRIKRVVKRSKDQPFSIARFSSKEWKEVCTVLEEGVDDVFGASYYAEMNGKQLKRQPYCFCIRGGKSLKSATPEIQLILVPEALAIQKWELQSEASWNVPLVDAISDLYRNNKSGKAYKSLKAIKLPELLIAQV